MTMFRLKKGRSHIRKEGWLFKEDVVYISFDLINLFINTYFGRSGVQSVYGIVHDGKLCKTGMSTMDIEEVCESLGIRFGTHGDTKAPHGFSTLSITLKASEVHLLDVLCLRLKQKYDAVIEENKRKHKCCDDAYKREKQLIEEKTRDIKEYYCGGGND